MKKIIVAVLLTLLTISACTFALADDVLLASRDLSITLLDMEIAYLTGKDGSETPYLSCDLSIENNTGGMLDFRGGNCTVNGIETDILAPSRVKTGTVQTDIMLMAVKGASSDHLFACESIDFDLTVSAYDTEDVLYKFPVHIDGEAQAAPAAEEAPAAPGAMEIYMEDDALVIAHDVDFSVRLGGWEMGGSDDSRALRIYPIIENRTDRILDFRLQDVTFDGDAVKGYGAYDVEPGTRADDFFMFKVENGDPDRLMDAYLVSFNLVVQDASTYDVVAEMPVVLTRKWLDMLYVGDTRVYEAEEAEETEEPAEAPAADPAMGVFEPYMENDTLVLMANDFLCLRLSGWEANLRDDGVTTRIYPIIENRTVRTLDFKIEDAYFDENPVDGFGIYDVESGVCADDFFMFKDPNGSAGYELLEPDTIRFKMVVRDSDDSSKILTEAYMTIPGDWLDMLYEGDPRDMHADYAYEYGEEEEYYEEYAYTAPEDPCPLEIFDGAYIEWYDLSDDQLKIRVQVQNSSWNLSVESFRINMYADDLWGNCLWEDGWVYYEETERYVAPGATAYSDYFYVPDRDEIGKVYFGISDVYCTNGREYHISDVEYWSWNLN